jgi:uncharacterized DUF497 family protein
MDEGYTLVKMKVGRVFDWDDANITHLARHRVRPAEAEQVLKGGSLPLGGEDNDEEERYTELGETVSGRLLMVAWTWRHGRIRVITAFPPGREWKAFWKKRKKETQHGKA